MSKVLDSDGRIYEATQKVSPGAAKAYEQACQPAEAEGVVDTGSDAWMALHLLDRLSVDSSDELRVMQIEGIVKSMGAALSAVTAERDRLLASKLYWVAPAGSGLVRCVTDERYRKFSPSIRAKYDPVCCVDAAMAAKEG